MRPHSHRHPGSPLLLALALAGLLLVPAVAGAAPPCTSRALPLTGVFTSATQTAGGDLLIADYNQSRLLEVELPSGSWGAVQGTTAELVERVRPVTVRRSNGGILLEQGSPREIVPLDASLRYRNQPGTRLLTDFAQGDTAGEKGVLRSLWIWEPVGNEIVGCSDILVRHSEPNEQPNNWRTSFVRYPLGAPESFRELAGYDMDATAALACRLKLPLIAALGDTAYFLAFEDDGPVVYASGAGERTALRRLPAIPAEFTANIPSLPIAPDFDVVPYILGKMAEASMPIGLYGWEDSLYLLSRTFDGAASAWWLTRIDPGQGATGTAQVRGTIRLDSQASHLMVVPGDQHWALIEKGPADSYTEQAVHRVLTVPADRLREAEWRTDRSAGERASLCGE